MACKLKFPSELNGCVGECRKSAATEFLSLFSPGVPERRVNAFRSSQNSPLELYGQLQCKFDLIFVSFLQMVSTVHVMWLKSSDAQCNCLDGSSRYSRHSLTWIKPNRCAMSDWMWQRRRQEQAPQQQQQQQEQQQLQQQHQQQQQRQPQQEQHVDNPPSASPAPPSRQHGCGIGQDHQPEYGKNREFINILKEIILDRNIAEEIKIIIIFLLKWRKFSQNLLISQWFLKFKTENQSAFQTSLIFNNSSLLLFTLWLSNLICSLLHSLETWSLFSNLLNLKRFPNCVFHFARILFLFRFPRPPLLAVRPFRKSVDSCLSAFKCKH